MVRGIEIHVTNKCNLNCYYCFAKKYRDESSINEHDFNILLEKLRLLGYSFLLFSGGGEPTLNRNFRTYMREAVQTGMEFALITNGTIIGHWSMEDIDYLIQNANWVRISLDACSPNKYRKIKGENRFHDVLTFLGKIQKENDRKTQIGVQILLTPFLDAKEINKCIDLVNKFNLDYLFIKSLHFTKLSKDRVEALTDLLKESKAPVVLDPYIQSQRFKVKECYAPYYMGAIDTKGNLWGCCKMVKNKKFLLGNLLTDDLDKIRAKLTTNTPIKRNELCPTNCLGLPPYPEIDSFGIMHEGKKDFVVAIDIDGTITTTSEAHHLSYKYATPNIDTIENLKKLKKKGIKIVIYTSRLEKDRKVTETMLKKWGVPYDDLIFGKLKADAYLDDKNLLFEPNWRQKLDRFIKSVTLNYNNEEDIDDEGE